MTPPVNLKVVLSTNATRSLEWRKGPWPYLN